MVCVTADHVYGYNERLVRNEISQETRGPMIDHIDVRGAVVHRSGEGYAVEQMRLAPPRRGEVLLRVMASGMCHSDDHLVTGDLPQPLPLVMGHEGAGIIDAVGEGVTSLQAGDHVSTAFVPACGRCNWCAQGMQYLCDTGAGISAGMMLDGSARFHLDDGRGIGAMTRLGTFPNWLVTSESQCVKIPNDVPFAQAALVACGVATGWGSAVNAAGITAGDVVLVVGIGGIGINAVQGAAMAGAGRVIAVDPITFKQDVALKLGATDSFGSIGAALPLIASLTNGQGVDQVIITAGYVSGELVGECMDAVRKGGTGVLTGVGQLDKGIAISPSLLTAYAKTLKGSLFGNCNPVRDIPRLLDYYRSGRLDLDSLITRTYAVDEVNQGYRDLHDGINIRGVIVHEH